MHSYKRHVLGAILMALGLATGGAIAHSTAATPATHANHDAHADHDAHEGHDAHADHAAPPDKAAETVTVRFADVSLVDHQDRQVRLESDIIGDDIVVMDFIYTSCTTVCPVVSAIMSEVQTTLGDRVGDDVKLVSMTVDPQRDTPARLREYAESRGAGSGWTWLTGSTTAVNETLKGFGTWTPNFEDHPVVMMVGDGRTGTWTRFYGFTDPAVLVARIDELTAARDTSAPGHHQHH